MSDHASARFASGRHAGAIVPLFSIPSRSSWGIGEIADLPRLATWLTSAGLDLVQLLPVNEMQEGQNSPYSALSAMAIDPIFIAVGELEEFRDAGGEQALSKEDRGQLDCVRRAAAVDYKTIRALKGRALRAAFAVFDEGDWKRGSARADAFRAYVEREAWWLREYTLFRALHDEHHGRYWLEWERELRDRDSAALSRARERLAPAIRYYEYLQWIADEQWRKARRDCGAVGLFGDFPFMVNGHSADVWARQEEFRYDASVGVPPDAFSESGQDWGMPVYRWDVVARSGYEWLRERAERCAELFDAFRIDHLVGFYRTFSRDRDGRSGFNPPDEASQRAQGEKLVALFAQSGARVIAEDLGVVPDFVRESLASLGIPGLKVMRWERAWKAPDRPFFDPAGYPACSVAISGTHDTETLAEWWETADAAEREAVAALPSLHGAGCTPDPEYTDEIRDALLTALFRSGSDFVIVPVQDIFGWRDRVNTPAVVDDQNWTWRLPWPVEDLACEPAPVERARFLRRIVTETGRA